MGSNENSSVGVLNIYIDIIFILSCINRQTH
jgi:hypothetical protein